MLGGIISLPKLGKKQAWRWKTRYRPTRILWVIVATIRGTDKLSGSISLLPPELLHAIFELLAFSDHNTLSSCMRVCRRWHDIARRHFFAVLSGSSPHREHSSQLLCADRRLAVYVKHVRFIRTQESHPWCKPCHQSSRAPFDVQSLASTLPVLGLHNLRYVSLLGYDNLLHPPLLLCQRPTQCPRTPVQLQRLSLEGCLGVTRILLDLLSLFSVHTLVIRNPRRDFEPSPWSPTSVHPPIPLASLAVQDLVLDTAHKVEEYYQFFQHMLIPQGLRALGIEVWNEQDPPKLGQFLRSGVAQNLLSISIDTVALVLFYGPPEDAIRQIFADGAAVFRDLGAAIAPCTRLRCFRIGFTHWMYRSWNPVFHRGTFEPIIANLPPTLRAFAIDIGVRGWQSWWHFCAEAGAGLDIVDRLLPPSGGGGRFPHLQRVELDVQDEAVPGWGIKEPITKPSPIPLPRLKAAGLLHVNVVHKVDHDRRRADVYLPPEIQ